MRVAWTAAGRSLSRWSADILSVDAFAIAATFGELCPNGRPCAGITNFISRDAGFAHENATVEDVLDLLRSSVLMAEQQWVELRGIVHNAGQGKALFAYTSGMQRAAFLFSPLSVAHEHASTSQPITLRRIRVVHDSSLSLHFCYRNVCSHSGLWLANNLGPTV